MLGLGWAHLGGAHEGVCSKLKGWLGAGCSAVLRRATQPPEGQPWPFLMAEAGIQEREWTLRNVITSPTLGQCESQGHSSVSRSRETNPHLLMGEGTESYSKGLDGVGMENWDLFHNQCLTLEYLPPLEVKPSRLLDTRYPLLVLQITERTKNKTRGVDLRQLKKLF